MTINAKFVTEKTANILFDMSINILRDSIVMIMPVGLMAMYIGYPWAGLFDNFTPVVFVLAVVMAATGQIFDLIFPAKEQE